MTTKKTETKIASHLRKLHGLRALMDDLSSPEKVVSRAKVLYPDTDPEQILKVIRTQYTSLIEEIEREKNVPLRRIGEYEKFETRPFYVNNDAKLTLDQSLIAKQLGALTITCPDLIIGQVKASGFNTYHWVEKEDPSSSAAMLFWPYDQYPSQLPNSTFSGDWAGNTGAWFVGWLTVKPKKYWFDPYDMVAHAAVFQFTISAPRCDSVVYWGTKGRVVATDWKVSADPGWADTDWLLLESPGGGGFPSTIEAFEFFPDGAFLNNSGVSETDDSEVWNRSFRVSAGVESKIYLGLSVMFFGRNGKISAPGLQSYFNFDYGITYFMVPDV